MTLTQSYFQIYLIVLTILCIFYSTKIYNSDNKSFLKNHNNFIFALIIGIILIFWLGLRPVNGFGDTQNYYASYLKAQNNPELALYETFNSEAKDLFFDVFFAWCAKYMDATYFFLIIEIFYISFTLLAIRILFPNNPFAAFLLTISSFSFFSYGVNGIRCGMACALLLFAFSLFISKKKFWIISVLLMIIAIGTHKSTMLPVLMFIISFFYIKNFKYALSFWFVSILISLTFGNSVTAIFEGLGFDDRLDKYIQMNEDADLMTGFSNSGFRWDFLLYSAVPIFLGYNIIIKKQIKNKTFEILLTTYTLSNAFWVMIIRAAFSNRFAYLSWFLYPIVIGLAFLVFDAWKNQARKFVLVLMGYLTFLYII